MCTQRLKHQYGFYSKEQGFTLVELITVIIILGILAVFVAPRFLTLSTEPTLAAERGVLTSLRQQQQRAMNDVVAANEYGVDLANTSAGLQVSTLQPQQTITFGGISVSTPTTLRFNPQGCLQSCNLADTELRIQGQNEAYICINRQGYIFAGRC